MIKLSNRLKAISEYIDDNDRIVDVGCDHALLDIYLVKTKKNIFCIASDIKENALNQARNNLEKYKVSAVDVRCGNGLNTISSNDNINTVIISGMGYQTILKILKENNKNLLTIDKLIIQSNNYSEIIRKNVVELGYYIFDEKLVKDGNIIYTIIVFKRGRIKYSYKELVFGPILLKNKNKLFEELLNAEIIRNKLLKRVIPFKYVVKRFKINNKIKLLEKEKNSC